MNERYSVQKQYGEWCVMEHRGMDVTIAVGCPIRRGGTEAGREYAERIVQALNERDMLRETLEMLCNGLEWHIENNPLIMNEADNEALAQARARLAAHAERGAS